MGGPGKANITTLQSEPDVDTDSRNEGEVLLPATQREPNVVNNKHEQSSAF